MKRRAALNLTINGVTYHGAGDSIAQAAVELERAAQGALVLPAAASVRWQLTPKGWAWAYRALSQQRSAAPLRPRARDDR